MKNAVLKIFAIFTGKLQSCNFIKNPLQYRCFPLNIAKFLRTLFWSTSAPRAAASVLTLLLNSDNLLIGYEQLKFINLCFISKRLIKVT